MYHFFVNFENIDGSLIHITGQDVNHIKNVLRMTKGEEVFISDGEGSDYRCSLSDFKTDEIIFKIIEKTNSGTELESKIYLFQGLPKADKFESIIQKSVELGVYEIIPVLTERSIVKYDEKKQKDKLKRWEKIAEGAAKQSHRGMVPEIREVFNFEDALKYAADIISGDGIILIPYENYKDIKETKAVISKIRPGTDVAIFIGPEGGFSSDEIEKAEKFNAKKISLGNRILRTETAPVMLLSVIMFHIETNS